MNHPSTVESSPGFDFVGQLSRFVVNTALQSVNSNGCSSVNSNYLFFDQTKRKVGVSLSLGNRGSSSVRRLWNEFNRAIRFHSDRIPIGFASISASGGDSSSNNGLRDDGCQVLVEGGLPLNGVEAEVPKKVLILMSDTGGGHRASAEAIKDAFYETFGDDYQLIDGQI